MNSQNLNLFFSVKFRLKMVFRKSRRLVLSYLNILINNLSFGGGRVEVLTRLCMVVDWCLDRPEYTAKIKVIPKKDYPVLMPCEF